MFFRVAPYHFSPAERIISGTDQMPAFLRAGLSSRRGSASPFRKRGIRSSSGSRQIRWVQPSFPRARARGWEVRSGFSSDLQVQAVSQEMKSLERSGIHIGQQIGLFRPDFDPVLVQGKGYLFQKIIQQSLSLTVRAFFFGFFFRGREGAWVPSLTSSARKWPPLSFYGARCGRTGSDRDFLGPRRGRRKRIPDKRAGEAGTYPTVFQKPGDDAFILRGREGAGGSTAAFPPE